MADKISLNEWAKYRDTLSKLSDKAAEEFRKYFFDANGVKKGTGLANATRQEVIDVAYAFVTKYGEAAAEVSCQMYDAIAALQKANIDGAIPAATATYQETAKAVNGTLKQSPTGQLLDGVIQRLVKQPAADTMLHNAKRHGAEWAWVPSGDTCVFCLTLASRGWQPASKAILKGGHAEHIHGHCDCQFAIRFDGLDVAGYEPDKYLELYNSAEGNNPDAKIQYLRRVQYSKNKEQINARKRELYQLKKESNESD